MRKLLINLTFLLLAATITSNAVEVADKSTFANPMLWADVPDPDVIRVGLYGKYDYASYARLSYYAFQGFGELGSYQLCV